MSSFLWYRAATATFWIYFGYSAWLVLVSFLQGDFHPAGLIRPIASLVLYRLAIRDAGRWWLFLAIWQLGGIGRSVIDGRYTVETVFHVVLLVTAFQAWRSDQRKDYFTFPLLTRLLARQYAKPDLRLIPLGSKFESVQDAFKVLIEQTPEKETPGVREFAMHHGDDTITIQVKDNEVVGVIYNVDAYRGNGAQVYRKLQTYIAFHSHPSPLRLLVNNGFGYIYRSQDQKVKGWYSFSCDIFSVRYANVEMT